MDEDRRPDDSTGPDRARATGRRELTVLRNGDQIFPAMLGAISAAQRTIDFLTFVYWRGDMAREFAQR